MTKRLKILMAAGAVAIFLVFVYWVNLTNHKLSSMLSFEPTYDGETVDYWLRYLYQQDGQRTEPAEGAVRGMGTNVLPYLIKWMRIPYRSSRDFHYASSALKGFEILGPTASPAIPDLVKMIGENGNYPAGALGYIGTNAIPALTNRLMEWLTATNPPPKQRFLFGSGPRRRIWPRDYFVPRNIFCALQFYGTNGRAAVPALISYARSPKAKDLAGAVGVLAVAGANDPNTVVPVLIETFSASAGYLRASTADALASFGTNAVSALPVLLANRLDKDATARAHIAVAILKIAPETPHAVDTIVQNLERGEALQQTLEALGSLGTNGASTLPVLAKCLRNPQPQVRTDTERCLQKLDRFSDEIIIGLGENLAHPNGFTSGGALEALSQFAGRSKLAYITLIKQALVGQIDRENRTQARYRLTDLSRQNPKFMLECLDDAEAQVRLGALIVFYDLERSLPSAIPKLRQLTATDPDAEVRKRAAAVLELQTRAQ